MPRRNVKSASHECQSWEVRVACASSARKERYNCLDHPPESSHRPMLKKLLLGASLLILVLSLGLFLWVRAVFTEDNVRAALADQLSKALGQPVKVGSIAAAIYPRVTVNLGLVSIGEPARIHVRTLHVGADLGALLSRRIEHARLELSGARVE